LEMSLGNYTLTDDFYVVDLVDTNVFLSVQWLYSMGKFSMNYQVMEMDFKGVDGMKVVLRVMSNGSPTIVSTKQLEGIFKHGGVSYATEYLITSKKTSDSSHNYHVDIQAYLSKHDRAFGDIPLGRPPYRGFKHTIELEEGGKPVKTTPYMYPKKFKD